MGTPVTLEMNGIVRLARGFSSRMYTVELPPSPPEGSCPPRSSLSERMITYWRFIRPRTLRAAPMRWV